MPKRMNELGTKMAEKEEMPKWPSVSVWVAARNEEENLGACLQALALQNYMGQWEILIGNDHSEDQTLPIAREFESRFAQFRVFDQIPKSDLTAGKALVLGHLAEKSKGEIFLICDADMQMPEFWIQNMVMELQSRSCAILNGTTTVKRPGLFPALQAIDWLLPQAGFSFLSEWGFAFTAMGNNMAITREAYWQTGGYLNLPFSLTEDFQLFREVEKNEGRLFHMYSQKVLGITAPSRSIKAWLFQHIRWMYGFMDLPFYKQSILYGLLVLYPLAGLSFLLPELPGRFFWIVLFLLKVAMDALQLGRIGRFDLLIFLPVYQAVWWPFYMTCRVMYGLRKHIEWKGRNWKK